MFSQTTLNLLPTKALAAISNNLTAKSLSKGSQLSSKTARLKRLNGYTEVSTTRGGKQTVEKVRSKDSAQTNMAQAAGTASTAALAQTLVDGGVAAYDPASLPTGTTGSPQEIEAMNAEVGEQIEETSNARAKSVTLKLQKAMISSEIAVIRTKLDATRQTLEQVNSVIKKRASGELPNPKLNYNELSTALRNILDGLEDVLPPAKFQALSDAYNNAMNRNLDDYEKFIIDRIVVPYESNVAALDIIAAQLKGEDVSEEPPSIFDTVYGPPVSTFGKFILSEDGLYYDSRSGGIPYISSQKINAASWQLRYSSNQGGKGELYASDKTSRLSDSIFDYDYKNESGEVLDFYKYDDTLRGLMNDRDLRIQDVSGKITDLIADGYAATGAVVRNCEESYGAIGYAAEEKIQKRKKQLQIAALFGPFGVTTSSNALGAGVFYKYRDTTSTTILDAVCGSDEKVSMIEYENNIISSRRNVAVIEENVEFLDRIPLNDFTYLKDIGILPELSNQESAMLHSSDLDDTTAPLPPVYLTKGPGDHLDAVPEMSIAPIGITDWVNTSGDTDLDGTIEYIRTLSDSIVTNNLILCYNFLHPSGVVAPSSSDYAVQNYANTGRALNAKMVGESTSAIFVSGVSIPYLTGSLYKPSQKYGIRYSHVSSGSYVRLPNNWRGREPFRGTDQLNDLMYNPKGWSFDFWLHAPTLNTLTCDHRYKLVASNENCGNPIVSDFMRGSNSLITAAQDTNTNVPTSRTRGMMIGFRDRGNPDVPSESSGLQFVALPTVGQNDIARWGKSVCIAETVSGEGVGVDCRTELGFKVDADLSTLSGYTVSACTSGFTHYALTCDLPTDSITLYVNGQFLASSNVSTAFGRRAGQPLNIPSQIDNNSFHDPLGLNGESLYEGPLPNSAVFTPWIIGGGFTDGISHEQPEALFPSTFPGFLGTNTNDDYFTEGYNGTHLGPSGGPIGQHSDLYIGDNTPAIPGLGGYGVVGSEYRLARSGLNGHVGSFKMYKAALTKNEVSINYKAQHPFFTGIKTAFRLL